MKSLILTLIGLILISCSSSTGPTKEMAVEDYFPYSEYSILTYRKINSWTNYPGKEGTIDTTYSTKTVDSKSLTFKGQTVYQVNSHYYNLVLDNEWREYGEIPNDSADYQIYLNEPIEVGSDQGEYDENYEDYRNVISKINVSLRTAKMGIINNCIEVVRKQEVLHGDTTYFAPEYGKIKIIYEDYGGKHLIDLIEVE